MVKRSGSADVCESAYRYTERSCDKYATFENYITERWQFSRQRGYQIINAADLTQKIAFYQAESLTDKDEKSAPKVHFLPSSETHLRPLIDSLKSDSERIAVWQNVVYDSKGEKVKITAAYVQKKVENRQRLRTKKHAKH